LRAVEIHKVEEEVYRRKKEGEGKLAMSAEEVKKE
jgi:hypothetical protein